MSNALSTLAIKLGLDGSGFTAGLNKAKGEFKSFAGGIAGKFSLGGLGSLGGVSGSLLGKAKDNLIEAFGGGGASLLSGGISATPLGAAFNVGKFVFDGMKKFADEAEESAQHQLQQHEKVRRLGLTQTGGAALEYLGRGNADALFEKLPRLNKLIGEAASGSSEAERVFAGIGLSARELANVSPETALIKISKAIMTLGSTAERSKATLDIFGKSGAQVYPILERISQGFEDARDTAAGLAPNDVLVAKAKDDAARERRMSLLAKEDDNRYGLGSGISDVIRESNWIPGNERTRLLFRLWSRDVSNMISGGGITEDARSGQLKAEADRIALRRKAESDKHEESKMSKGLVDTDIDKAIDELNARKGALGKDSDELALIKIRKHAEVLGVTTEKIAQLEAVTQSFRSDAFNQSLVESNRGLETQIANLGKASWEAKQYELSVEAAAHGITQLGDEADKSVQRLAELEGKKLDQAAMSPLELAQRELGRLGDLKKFGDVSDRGYENGIFGVLRELDSKVNTAVTLPSALEANSIEGVSFLNNQRYMAATGSGGSLADRLPDLFQRAVDLAASNNEEAKKTNEALQKIKDKLPNLRVGGIN
ncbi:MAG: hypothetical protein ACJ8C4_05775 [Gemmataceae bacterium]